MGGVTTAPYGTWKSPITADIVAGSSLSFDEVHTDLKSGSIYLVEGRPAEKGRKTILLFKDGRTIEILPKEYSAASQVHEYGGGAVSVSSNGTLIFTDKNTSGVFRLTPTGEVTEIVRGDKDLRYADFGTHPTNEVLILAIQEDHSGKEVRNTVVLIDAGKKSVKTLVEGPDFCSHPKFCPDGKSISWLQWYHPDMPWTGTEVYIADLNDEGLGEPKYVAGKAKEESISEPKWHIDGTLLFCSDRTGFWQLYQYDPTTTKTRKLEMKGLENAEVGIREFILGCCTYVPLTKTKLALRYTRKASNTLVMYDLDSEELSDLETGLVEIDGCAIGKVSESEIAVIGTSPTTPTGLYLINTTEPQTCKLLKSSSGVNLGEDIFSKAQSIEYPRLYGTDSGSTSYAMFMPPHNPSFNAPQGSKPPLIVSIHGGPTSHRGPGLSRQAQYFTSRGYAYCFINYAGSTGYGRKYRQLLDYSWGLSDCEDTVSCIEYLSKQGFVDGSKVGITGGSAGGYTTLQAMVTFPKSFTAGCSLYGIGNLKALEEDTHKFESHYLFALLFPEGTPREEQEKIYYDRSPCFHAKKIERPLVLLQGSIDKVVPPEQSEEMERILKTMGRDVKLVIFEGEGHGFRMSENIKRALEEEEALWKRTLV